MFSNGWLWCIWDRKVIIYSKQWQVQSSSGLVGKADAFYASSIGFESQLRQKSSWFSWLKKGVFVAQSLPSPSFHWHSIDLVIVSHGWWTPKISTVNFVSGPQLFFPFSLPSCTFLILCVVDLKLCRLVKLIKHVVLVTLCARVLAP